MLNGRSFRLRRLLAGGLAALALAACSVSTPRDGLIQGASGQQSFEGAAAGTGEAGQLGVGEGMTGADGAAAGDALAGAAASGGTQATAGAGQAQAGQAGQAGSTSSTGSGGAAAGAAQAAATGPSGPVPGVTAKEIRFSVLAGFSGMYGQILDGVVESGFGTWVDDINARGGINGRRIVMIKVDNKDTAEGGVAGCKQIQENKSYFAFSLVGFGGADVSATDCLDRAAIPTISYLVSAYNNRWKSVYTISEPGVTSRPLASFIKNFLKRGNTKIGLFVERDPLFTAGKQPFLDGMAELGMQVVHTETVAPGQSSFVSEASRMKSSGAETVVMIVSGPSGIGIPRDARAVGYEPTFTGALWIHDEFSTAAASVQQGMQGLRYYASVNSPAYAKFVETANKYGRGNNTTALTMSVYGLGLVVEKVLQNVGPTPTREGFGPAVEQIVNYENGIVGLSFGKGNRRAEGLQYPVKCCNPNNTWMGIGAPQKAF